jgi:hypothetical protein
MKNVLLMIRNGAFAVAIAVALSFGAAEALSGSPAPTASPECTFPDYCEDDEECMEEICWQPPVYWGGTCDHNCCTCFE